jgi:SnoaL-like domain
MSSGSPECAARLAIADLVMAYTRAGDTGRIDEFVDCFAADGVLEVKGRAHLGHDAIASFVGDVGARFTGRSGFLPARHHVASAWCELGNDGTARGGAYFTLMAADGPDHWGVYRDRYVLVDGRWRFAHRCVRTEGARAGSPVADLVE